MSMATERFFGIGEKNRRKGLYWLNVCALLSIPVLEIALDHYLFSGRPGALCEFLTFKGCWAYPLIFYFVALLFLVRLGFWFKDMIKRCRAKKKEQVRQSKNYRLRNQLILLLKSIISLDPADTIITLLFLLHLTWIPDSFFDYMKETASYNLWHPTIFMGGFLCILFFASQQGSRGVSRPTVLFTGLSHLSLSTLMPFFRPLAEQFRDIREIVVFVDENVSSQKTRMPNEEQLNLVPCWDSLFGDTLSDEDRMSLEKQYMLSQETLRKYGVSRDALIELESGVGFANKTKEEKLTSLKTFLKTTCTACLKDEVTVELISCDYFSDTNILVGQIQNEVKRRVWPRGIHEDGELLFNLTPGTTSISVALAFNASAFNAARGARKTCYIEQKDKQLKTYSLESIE
jgi:hypothetical protein